MGHVLFTARFIHKPEAPHTSTAPTGPVGCVHMTWFKVKALDNWKTMKMLMFNKYVTPDPQETKTSTKFSLYFSSDEPRSNIFS